MSPLAELSARAGHTVLKIGGGDSDASASSSSELIIVVGDRASVSGAVAAVVSSMNADAVVVDATTTFEDDQGDGVEARMSGAEWLSRIPATRLVRAFASVPAAAFLALAAEKTPHDVTDLAVPLTGDDADAKTIVGRFMKQIGVDPFDVGPLAVSYVMEPGGPLWGKAGDALEMSECIGWLAGDG